MSEPLISIIIPVYNVEKYLPQCLDSVIGQTYKNIEIICVNDGSTDGSLDILKKYERRSNRIKIITQKNEGLSSARNVGIKECTGDYIMFLDSDDWIDNKTCMYAYRYIKEYDVDIALWSYMREFGDRSIPKRIIESDTIYFNKENTQKQIYRRCVGLYKKELSIPENADSLVTAWGKLYRSSLIKNNRIEFVDIKKIGTEDALFNIQVLGYANSSVYIDKYLNHYRKDNDLSLTSCYKKELFERWQNLYDNIHNLLIDRGVDSSFFEALNNRISLSIIGLGLNILSSPMSVLKKIKEINRIVSSKRYQEAYEKLTIEYMPLHWKIFFGAAKHKNAVVLYLLLVCIRSIIKK